MGVCGGARVSPQWPVAAGGPEWLLSPPLALPSRPRPSLPGGGGRLLGQGVVRVLKVSLWSDS